MEHIHGVDTSWLHHSKGQTATHGSAPSQNDAPSERLSEEREKEREKASLGSQTQISNGASMDGHASRDAQFEQSDHLKPTSRPQSGGRKTSEKSGHYVQASPAAVTPPTPTTKSSKGSKTALSPGLGRKPSWMSSLTSKFGGQQSNGYTAAATATKPSANAAVEQSDSSKASPVASSPGVKKNETAPIPGSPKPAGSGFLSSALRRFSSASGANMPKASGSGSICPRKVMNVDHHRERCQIPDFQPAKMRRVAFCVDVEIAAAPKYKEEEIEEPLPISPGAGYGLPYLNTRRRASSLNDKDKKSKVKNKERSEGEALKNPNAMAERKEKVSEKSSYGNGDPFEVPEIETPPAKTVDAKMMDAGKPDTMASKPLESKPASSPALRKVKSLESRPRRGSANSHPDFGPNGMFEVDDWSEPETREAQKPMVRKGSTGGSVHHDFGRHGMFEIPSESEDDRKSKPLGRTGGASSDSDVNPHSPRGIAKRIGKMPPGHIFSEKLMFEIPDLQDVEVRKKVEAAIEEFQGDLQETTPKKDGTENGQEANSAVAAPAPETVGAKTSKGSKDGEASQDPEAANAKKSENNKDDAAAPKETSRKKEKKKRSEEERKERKEKKRQAAIANGTLPVEVSAEDGSPSAGARQPTQNPPQSRPTTDPLRIYRRCCQLRETTPLPRVVEQLAVATAVDPSNPAVVLSLDLSGQTIELPNIVTLGDWLAVVPVQKLLLENCGLTDEALRVVLSGLLSVKTAEQAKHNKHLAKKQNLEKKERLGVISKLSLKGNKLIGKQGWMHLAYFINMSKSLKAIDLSLIPFPRVIPPPSRLSDDLPSSRPASNEGPRDTRDPLDIFWKSITSRIATDNLEELVMGDCGLSAAQVEKLIDAVISCRVGRLGLAHNDLDTRSYKAVARYLNSFSCMGIDLGGNDLSNDDNLQIILDAINSPENNMYAISFADCKIAPSHLKKILSVLVELSNIRFLDLSHNRELFSQQPNAIPSLSRYLPRMKIIKRINLNDVAMRPEHAIALAEICPEIHSLAHLSIMQNPALSALADAKDEETQEEACALYASLMAATRVSKSIMCIDIDVPSAHNSEVVKSLAKQVVAYSLRNMERADMYKSAASVIAEPHGGEKAVEVPDVLLHLVGHVDNLDMSHENDPPAPDQDYLVGGTGVVKALSIVLGNKSKRDSRLSREFSPSASGTASPKLSETAAKGKARDMSKNLLDSARKIRHRLQPALVRAMAETPEEESSKRLTYLDSMLERVIQRFEDEYPDCRPIAPSPASMAATSDDKASELATPSASFTNPFTGSDEALEPAGEAFFDADEHVASLTRASRHGSDVSLHSRQLVNEEGRLHKFGQRMRRDLMPPVHTVDHHWGTTGEGGEPGHIAELRAKLDSMTGEEMRAKVEQKGLEKVVAEMKLTAESMRVIRESDPEQWNKCRMAGMTDLEMNQAWAADGEENDDEEAIADDSYNDDDSGDGSNTEDVTMQVGMGSNVATRNGLINGA